MDQNLPNIYAITSTTTDPGEKISLLEFAGWLTLLAGVFFIRTILSGELPQF